MRNLLLLCNRPARGSNAQAILENIDAIKAMPGFRVHELSMLGDIPATVDLDRFDVVGIHYTLHISDPTDHFLSQKAMDHVSAFTGVKCIWMHDEYRQVNATIAKLRHMGIDTVFTVIPEKTAAKVYTAAKLPNTVVKTILTGYVGDHLRCLDTPPFSDRNIDVVYRARRPPFWLGRLGMEKVDIGLRFQQEGEKSGLKTDISVEEWDRIYANQWLDLLQRAKAGLSVESGSSIIDFTGRIEAAVETFVSEQKDAVFADVAHIIAEDDDKYVINCISPKIFEMAACRTLMIAYPGEYSDIIKPWIHYLPLSKNFSNFDEITRILTNEPDLCNEIINNSYNDLIASGAYDYDGFSAYCSEIIPQSKRISKSPYSDARFFFDCHRSLTYLVHHYVAYIFQRTVLRSSMRQYLIAIWSRLPKRLQVILRPHIRFIGR